MSKYWKTSWNPMCGCTPESEACDNCWARVLHTQRHNANCHVAAGAVMGRLPAPKARAAEVPLPMPAQYDLPFSHIQLFADRLSEPLHWRKPRTVAVCFMGDLFHPEVPDEFVFNVLATMLEAEAHTFLVLTKRAERMQKLLAGQPLWACEPAPNVWLGVTAENQRMADERIPLLLATPSKHWVSLEPLLGPVDLVRAVNHLDWLAPASLEPGGLDWVVVGGESGPGHRPLQHSWVYDIRDQCAAAGVAFWGKQDSGSRPGIPLGGGLDVHEQPWAALGKPGSEEE